MEICHSPPSERYPTPDLCRGQRGAGITGDITVSLSQYEQAGQKLTLHARHRLDTRTPSDKHVQQREHLHTAQRGDAAKRVQPGSQAPGSDPARMLSS